LVFSVLAGEFLMKNCVWLKPELVAQIEFTKWSPDRHLRHSKFVGLREDKDAREVRAGGRG
jgi:ATP-dependent DNA ligase